MTAPQVARRALRRPRVSNSTWLNGRPNLLIFLIGSNLRVRGSTDSFRPVLQLVGGVALRHHLGGGGPDLPAVRRDRLAAQSHRGRPAGCVQHGRRGHLGPLLCVRAGDARPGRQARLGEAPVCGYRGAAGRLVHVRSHLHRGRGQTETALCGRPGADPRRDPRARRHQRIARPGLEPGTAESHGLVSRPGAGVWRLVLDRLDIRVHAPRRRRALWCEGAGVIRVSIAGKPRW